MKRDETHKFKKTIYAVKLTILNLTGLSIQFNQAKDFTKNYTDLNIPWKCQFRGWTVQNMRNRCRKHLTK